MYCGCQQEGRSCVPLLKHRGGVSRWPKELCSSPQTPGRSQPVAEGAVFLSSDTGEESACGRRSCVPLLKHRGGVSRWPKELCSSPQTPGRSQPVAEEAVQICECHGVGGSSGSLPAVLSACILMQNRQAQHACPE
ncbi:hypothetical protein EYF80_065612 [Liparis tanakae]|uniref:Uncharacterized protein n=1 Tax=Liparis tanakae TaxID=230148 RepID=A0A4Z2E664_9TELE|nr:hypothetical protein EYF80_065612 [Liparis tanakae]